MQNLPSELDLVRKAYPCSMWHQFNLISDDSLPEWLFHMVDNLMLAVSRNSLETESVPLCMGPLSWNFLEASSWPPYIKVSEFTEQVSQENKVEEWGIFIT